MTPAPWGWWRRIPSRRRGDNRHNQGNLARPGREQPNPGHQRSRVTGAEAWVWKGSGGFRGGVLWGAAAPFLVKVNKPHVLE